MQSPPPSVIVQNDDKFDSVITGTILTAGRELAFDSLPNPNIMPGCSGNSLLGTGSLWPSGLKFSSFFGNLCLCQVNPVGKILAEADEAPRAFVDCLPSPKEKVTNTS